VKISSFVDPAVKKMSLGAISSVISEKTNPWPNNVPALHLPPDNADPRHHGGPPPNQGDSTGCPQDIRKDRKGVSGSLTGQNTLCCCAITTEGGGGFFYIGASAVGITRER